MVDLKKRHIDAIRNSSNICSYPVFHMLNSVFLRFIFTVLSGHECSHSIVLQPQSHTAQFNLACLVGRQPNKYIQSLQLCNSASYFKETFMYTDKHLNLHLNLVS